MLTELTEYDKLLEVNVPVETLLVSGFLAGPECSVNCKVRDYDAQVGAAERPRFIIVNRRH